MRILGGVGEGGWNLQYKGWLLFQLLSVQLAPTMREDRTAGTPGGVDGTGKRLPGQCHLYLMDIEWNGYGYWPGSLPGITASRWTFPVVDAVTPKGWTLSWACRARTISGSPPYLPVLSPLLKELLYTLQLEHRPAGLIVYMVTGQCVQSITLS